MAFLFAGQGSEKISDEGKEYLKKAYDDVGKAINLLKDARDQISSALGYTPDKTLQDLLYSISQEYDYVRQMLDKTTHYLWKYSQ